MTFFWTPVTLTITIVVLLFSAVCCWISWRRSGYTRSMGLLEVFRFALIALVLLTLNQPEITQEIRPEERPTLVILHDTSDSMKTVDVVSEAGSSRDAVSRNEAAAPAIDPQAWGPVAEKMEVIFQPFSSKLANPAKGTDIEQALSYAVDSHANLRGVVLLSDGDWNTGVAPNGVATDLRMRKIPVFAAGVGSETRLPDIELICSDAPTFGVIGKTMRIPFRIVSWLPGDRTVTLTLQGTRSENIVKVVSVPGMGQVQDTIDWQPRDTGEYELSLDIPTDDAEAITTNNSLKFPVTVKNEALRVLVVESFPRWEYRYLRNALERDPGVEVNCLLFHPDLDAVGGGRGYLEEFPDEKELFKYDVVFLGDVGVDASQLSVENCEHIRQLVRNHAGGLVFLPGFRGKQSTLLTTQLEELYPVVPDETAPRGIGQPRPARFALTESGRRSLLTRLEPDDNDNENVWNALPGFQWYAATLRSKIGSEVLAVHGSDSTRFGRIPVIATRTSGTGKVLFMGTDGAWRWRRGVEDLYHYRFWGQVVRWMAYQRNMSQGESMRLFYSPDRPEAGNVLTLNANVMSDSGEPLREGTVVVQIVSPSGQTDSVRLASVGEDSWGLFSGSFTPEEGGNYSLVTTCSETGSRLETTVAVKGNEKEKIGQPARLDVLREIAEVTRGELTDVSQLNELVDRVAELPEPEPVITRVRIWSHPLWGGALIVLLGAFWTGRKMAGLA
ncbi:MAG: VWA domain-containing protein [Planctomycetaceae bacterium]|nr:VWA domain-containing protein [Planctomycetaceae bacterium]